MAGIFGGGAGGISTVFALQAVLSLNSDGFRSGLQSAGSEAESQSQSVSGALSAMGAVALEALQRIADFMGGVVSSGSQFETAFAQLQTIADTSTVSVDDLSRGVRDLSTELGVSASEIAVTAYSAISAGADTADALDEVRTAGRLATAGFTDTNSALSVLRTAMNAYGDSAGTAEEISDQLIQTQNLGVTTVADLASNMGRAIATGSAYGVNLQNLEAAYISLTKQGINTAMGTTYLSGLITELGSSGSTVSDILMNETGQSFGQLMDDGYSLADVLGVLMDSVDGDSEAFANLFGNARAAMAGNAIINNGLQTFNDNLVTLGNSAGTTEEAYSIMTDTFQHRSDVLNTTLENLKISVFEAFEPLLTRILEAVQGFLDRVDIEQVAGMIQKVVTAVAAFSAVILTAVGVVKAITAAQRLFNIVMNANPIMLIITLIATLVSALITLWTTNEDFRNAVINIFTHIRDFFVTIFNFIKDHIIEPIKTAIRAIVQFFYDHFVQPTVERVEFIRDVFLAVVGFIRDHIIEPIKEALRAVVQFFYDHVVVPTQERIEFIKSIIQAVVGFLRDRVIQPIKDVFERVINWIRDHIVEPIRRFVDTIKRIVGAIVGFFRGRAEESRQGYQEGDWEGAGSRVVNRLRDGMHRVREVLTNKIRELAESILDRWRERAERWREMGSNVINGIREGMERAKQAVMNFIHRLTGDMTSSAQRDMGIHSPSEVMAKMFENVPLGMAEGISRTANVAIGAVSDVIEGMMDEADSAAIDIPLGIDDDMYTDMTAEISSNEENIIDRMNSRIDANFNSLLKMLGTYFPQLANQQIVLDSGVLAGAVNRRLGLEY